MKLIIINGNEKFDIGISKEIYNRNEGWVWKIAEMFKSRDYSRNEFCIWKKTEGIEN